MIKWLRVLVAVTIFCVLSWYFVVIDKESPDLHQLAQIQFTQALLGGMIGIVAVWLVVALLFGRVYCSAICPFGVLQDVFSRIAKLVRGKKRKFAFRPAMTKTRLAIFAIFVTGLLAFPSFVSLLDPYSNYGRIVTSTLRPAYRTANDALAKREQSKKNYDTVFLNVDEYARRTYPSGLLAALAALGVVGVFATLYGRRYCNTICPVGTLLGLLSRRSYFKVRLKHDCVSCGLCAAACKGECIDAKNKTVDSSRCVACFNCLSTCRRGSLTYSSPLPVIDKDVATDSPRQHAAMTPQPAGGPAVRTETESNDASTNAAILPGTTDPRRRRFLHWSMFSLLVPAAVGVWAKKAKAASTAPDPGLPQGKSVVGYEKTTPVIPPGANNVGHYKRHCTGCHLCVSKCPTGIITPSAFELGLSGFMQPVVTFEHRYCDYDCVICTTVCPSHALLPLTKEEKHLTRVGKAVFIKRNCVVHSMGENCGACDEHCPTKAIKMVPHGDPSRNLVIPTVDTDLCVGCGACEHVGPVRPYRAIYVDGLAVHEQAKPAFDPNAKQEDVSGEIDFPF